MTHPSQIALVIGGHTDAERQMLRFIDAAATTATPHQAPTSDRDAFIASRLAWCRHVPALLYPAPRAVGAIAATALMGTVSSCNSTSITKSSRPAADDALVASVIGRVLASNAAALMAAPTVCDTWLAAAARAVNTNTTTTTSATCGEEGGDCGNGKQSSDTPKVVSTTTSVIADATHFKAVERSFAARGVPLEEILCNGHCRHIPGTGTEALVFPYQQHGTGGGLQGSAVMADEKASTLFQDWAVLLRRGQVAERVDKESAVTAEVQTRNDTGDTRSAVDAKALMTSFC